MVDKTGQLGVPVIEIDGKAMVGFNEEALAKALGI
jgi:glutaredoxin